MRPLACLLLLAALVASGAEPDTNGESFGALNAELARWRADFKRVRGEILRFQGELEVLREAYGKDGLTPETDRRRRELIDAAQPTLSEFYELKARADELNGKVRAEAAFVAAQGFSGKAGVPAGAPAGAPAGIAHLMEFENARRDAQSFSGDISDYRLGEGQSYAYAVDILRRKERLRRAALWLGPLLLAAAAALVRLRRGASPPPTSPGALPSPAATPREPVLLDGNYRLGREIGRGGMGLVFEAEDTALARKVAVKRMKKEVVENRRELDMFLEEARLVAALKHPNLVEIHAIVREAGQLYLIFEYVAGEPLHRVIEARERIAPPAALDILRQIADGLDYAHSKKVIHRDLKPANIMLAEGGAVKIMDFGLAHQAKRTVAKLTQAAAWGTPPYMSPEQELGRVSKESDVYSLGACFYEMTTGEPAFRGPDFLKQKRALDFVAPSELRPELPRALDAVLRRALAPAPEDRQHSGAELYAAAAAAFGA